MLDYAFPGSSCFLLLGVGPGGSGAAFLVEDPSDPFEKFGAQTAPAAGYHKKFVADRRHGPLLEAGYPGEWIAGRQLLSKGLGVSQLSQGLFGLAVQSFADQAKRQALGLVDADGEQLQPVLFGEGLGASADRGIEEAEGPVVTDGPFREDLGRLAVGGMNLVIVAPPLDRCSEFAE